MSQRITIPMVPPTFRPTHLAQWYFRLNGFFTICNFVLHPDRSGSAKTDVDIAGVRFANREEFPQGEGGDDVEFLKMRGKLYVVLAEVKTGECEINDSWTKPESGIARRVLTDLGKLCNSLRGGHGAVVAPRRK